MVDYEQGIVSWMMNMAVSNTNPADSQKPTTQKENGAVEEIANFHPVQISNESKDARAEKESDKERRLHELLHSLIEESMLLSDHMATERRLITDVSSSLTQVLKRLNVSVVIPPARLPLDKRVKQITLDRNGNLKLVYDNRECQTAQLGNYSPETVAAVLWVVMPELPKAIAKARKKLNTRTSFLEGVKEELQTTIEDLGPEDQNGANGR
jgi:hypothetical protein